MNDRFRGTEAVIKYHKRVLKQAKRDLNEAWEVMNDQGGDIDETISTHLDLLNKALDKSALKIKKRVRNILVGATIQDCESSESSSSDSSDSSYSEDSSCSSDDENDSSESSSDSEDSSEQDDLDTL